MESVPARPVSTRTSLPARAKTRMAMSRRALFAFYISIAQGSAELSRCSACKRAVGPLAVVLLTPVIECSPCVILCAEPTRVQEFIAKTSMEAFDVSVLHRSTRLDGWMWSRDRYLGRTPGALRWSPSAEVEIHSVLYTRGFETRSEAVVEIEPEKASKFNRPQQISTDIHKVL